MTFVVIVDRRQHDVHEDVDVHNDVSKEEQSEPVASIVSWHPTERKVTVMSHLSLSIEKCLDMHQSRNIGTFKALTAQLGIYFHVQQNPVLFVTITFCNVHTNFA